MNNLFVDKFRCKTLDCSTANTSLFPPFWCSLFFLSFLINTTFHFEMSLELYQSEYEGIIIRYMEILCWKIDIFMRFINTSVQDFTMSHPENDSFKQFTEYH